MVVFEGCDLLDVGGPYEVLLTANRLAQRNGAPAPFDVHVVSRDKRPVLAYGGLGLVPTGPAPAHIDVVVIPGLIDHEAGMRDATLVAHVSELTGRASVAASVCTGSFLLAAAGRLAGRAATTHHEDLAALEDLEGTVGEVLDGVRWVDTGDVVTAAGLSSGLALGLHLVDRLAGRELAMATAAQIEYPWSPDDGVERPLQATPGSRHLQVE